MASIAYMSDEDDGSDAEACRGAQTDAGLFFLLIIE